MKLLKGTLYFLLIMLAAILLASLFAPSNKVITRIISIDAPREVVFAQLADLRKWPKWDAWYPKDLSQERTFDGGLGDKIQSFSWSSEHEKLGNGSIVVKSFVSNVSLDFMLILINNGRKYSFDGNFMLKERNGQTVVTWNVESEQRYPIKIINYFLEKSQSRILSISLVHQNLYENENLEKIDYKLYLEDMCKNFDSVLNIWNKNIRYVINVDAIFLDLQTAIPLGLILNELISNSYKHAFTTEIEGMIEISIAKNFEKEYILSYSDNGIGLPTDNKKTHKSLGLELIQLLTKQLRGKLTKENTKKGLAYQIVFNEIT